MAKRLADKETELKMLTSSATTQPSVSALSLPELEWVKAQFAKLSENLQHFPEHLTAVQGPLHNFFEGSISLEKRVIGDQT